MQTLQSMGACMNMVNGKLGGCIWACSPYSRPTGTNLQLLKEGKATKCSPGSTNNLKIRNLNNHKVIEWIKSELVHSTWVMYIIFSIQQTKKLH